MGVSISQVNGVINVNGKKYCGKSVVIKGNKVIIDGVEQDKDNDLVGDVNSSIDGNVGDIQNDSGDIRITGDAKNISAHSGDIYCEDVNGNATTYSGDIQCGHISGNTTTYSGDIRNAKWK